MAQGRMVLFSATTAISYQGSTYHPSTVFFMLLLSEKSDLVKSNQGRTYYRNTISVRRYYVFSATTARKRYNDYSYRGSL